MQLSEITPAQLRAELESEIPPILLDVRELHELEISVMQRVIHIPMHLIPSRLHEFDKGADIVVICRVGQRSRYVTEFLMQQGFSKVRNLSTGMNGWAQTIDPTMQQY